MGAQHQKTRPLNILHRDKQAQCLDLRRQGLLLREIAERLDIPSCSTVSKLITSALKEIVREPAEHVLALELDRLDAVFYPAFARASDKSVKFDSDAVATCLRIMERRAKLLGLDRPTLIANTDPSGTREASRVLDKDVLAEIPTEQLEVLLQLMERLGVDDQPRNSNLPAREPPNQQET
jgi:hypothetical protein